MSRHRGARRRAAHQVTQDLAAVDAPSPGDTGLTPDLAQQVISGTRACAHCGGRHVRACPRVKRMAWHPGGALAEIEFWPDDQWSDAHVIWQEELEELDT